MCRQHIRATGAMHDTTLRRGEACLAPIETPELCKVPGLQCIMAAAHVRLSEARGCSTLRPCCIASGTQARFAAVVSRPCNPVNYRAGTVAPCKQQERNRLPVKGEIYRRAFVIYLGGLTKSESRRLPNRHITGATTGVLSASTKRKRSGRQGAPCLAQSCAPPAA